MKKILLVILLAIGVSLAGFAQSDNTRVTKRVAKPGQSLKNLLSLTNEQAKKVDAIYASQANARNSLIATARSGKDRNAVMAGLTKLMNESSAKIKAILTADQAKIYQKQLDERAEMMKRFQQGQN